MELCVKVAVTPPSGCKIATVITDPFRRLTAEQGEFLDRKLVAAGLMLNIRTPVRRSVVGKLQKLTRVKYVLW